MKTNKLLASIVLGLSFPALYLLWVQNMKNTWVLSHQQIDRKRYPKDPSRYLVSRQSKIQKD
jgi:hypothetical protein